MDSDFSGDWCQVGAALAHTPTIADDSSSCTCEVEAFFLSKGLGRHAKMLAEVTEAQAVSELALLDVASVEEAICLVGLGLVPAQKFRLAIQEAHGAGPQVSSPTSPVAPPASLLEECIVICIDRSGSMGSPFSTGRTRMEAVKQMFYAFRDRTGSLGGNSHRIGLIQFDDKVDRLLEPTLNLDVFESVVDNMEKRGSTAIYSGVIHAAAMLEATLMETPSADLRILALTDGQNNAGCEAEEALAAALRVGAVVDAIIVGDQPDSKLRRIVKITGGECFQIASIGEGFELLEAERVVSLRARRGGEPERSLKPDPAAAMRAAELMSAAGEKEITRGNAVSRAAPAVSDTSTRVADAANIVAHLKTAPPSSTSARRVLKEIDQVARGDTAVWKSESGNGVHIFPGSENVMFWRALLEGPLGSPFEGGVFVLTVVLPNDYPFKPPSVIFETPVHHCNVSDSGRICIEFLQGSWGPNRTVPEVLALVRHMLAEPNTDDALRQWVAEETIAHIQHGDKDTRYPDAARASVLNNASVSVDAWKKCWSCEA